MKKKVIFHTLAIIFTGGFWIIPLGVYAIFKRR